MQKSIVFLLAVALTMAALFADAKDDTRIDVARFDAAGNILVPEDLDEWVFIGSSLGMGYSQQAFDPDSPGMFQIVRMEPQAYAAFKKTGTFVDGTMFSLHFYGSQNEISINRAGYVMDNLHFAEIHYKDNERFPDGSNFYNLVNGEPIGTEIPLPNDCVTCHDRDGAYDGVFVQFYPTIFGYLPISVRESLAATRASAHH